MRFLSRLNLMIIAIVILAIQPISVMALGVDDLNSIYQDTVWYNPTGIVASCGGGSSNLSGNDNIQKTMNFLLGKGLNALQASAMIGNFEQESGQGMDPNAVQPGGPGRGIAQWSVGDRWDGVIKLAQQEGGSPTDLAVQLDFVWQELTAGYAGALSSLKSTSDITTATQQFEAQYEAAGDPQMQNRINYAQDVFTQYGGGSASTTSGGSSSPAGCSASVNCSTPSSSAGLSNVRKNVVCTAQQELATWKSQPGYPTPAYSQSGYLKYSAGSPEEWCADFTSWIYNQVGYPMSSGLSGGWRLPAVSSIQSLGEKNQSFKWHPAGSGYTPQPGDLAIHGPNHVNIFISSQGGISQYIGGDQGSGPYPGGSIVSIDTASGYYSDITGYVSPD